jgi:hypothetical protein
VYDNHAHQRRDRLSHHQNLTGLSALGSILKDFREPMSVDVRVILLVEYNKTLYIPCRVGNSWGFHVYVHDNHTHQQRDRLSHHQNLTSVSAFGSIFERFLRNYVNWCEGRTLG